MGNQKLSLKKKILLKIRGIDIYEYTSMLEQRLSELERRIAHLEKKQEYEDEQ